VRAVQGEPQAVESRVVVVLAAGGRKKAVDALRRPTRSRRTGNEDEQFQAYAEDQPRTRAGSADALAPRREGIWALVPYLAVVALVGLVGYFGSKRLVRRSNSLVQEFGVVLVRYGSRPDAAASIVDEYKRKLGPGLYRGRLFASFACALAESKPADPAAIKLFDVVRKRLGVSEIKATKELNRLADAQLRSSPSVLGKLLFLSERALGQDSVSQLTLRSLFPYSDSVVSELQENMAIRIFGDLCEARIHQATSEDDLASITAPTEDATLLGLSEQESGRIFHEILEAKRIARAREIERLEVEAAEAEGATRPNNPDLDFPARSGEPAKALVHAYQCGDCGYTIYPAAGREFKFFGSDFVCPACGAPKDRFSDVNTVRED